MIKHQYRMSDLHTIKDLTLRKLAGDLFCYRIDGFTPKIFAREKPLARRSQKSPKNRAISPSYRI